MKLLRLRLKNYRGIADSEVKFCPQGLTIVEGPNEVGKTSLSEAVRILFDYLDSSKRNEIKAIKPVARDVGPEIELEAECGPYVFKYFKRFYKRPETTLTITDPKPENHTGREAHERAEEILRETIDVDLWKALCIQQGESVHQADFSQQTSLSAALDNVAGGHQTGPQEESLFEKVREEYGHYYTEGGKERKELLDAKKTQEYAETAVASLKSQISSLDNDILRAAELSQVLERLKKQEDVLRVDVSEYTKSLDEIKDLESSLETARLRLESAEKSETAAKQDSEVRQGLIDAVARAMKVQADLEESSTASEVLAKRAQGYLENAESNASKAGDKRKQAELLLRLRRADFDYFNDKLHLEQLKERKGRIDRARSKTAKAEMILASNSVDETTLKAIQKTEQSFITAEAMLKIGAPSLQIVGLNDLDIRINKEQISISKDEVMDYSISDRLYLTIPGAMQMEIVAGSSSTELSDNVRAAKDEFESVCNSAGVTSADDARTSYDARREAQQSIARQTEIEADDLRDLTYEELESKVIRLGESVPGYPEVRVSEPPLPDNLGIAKKELQAEEDKLDSISGKWEEAETALDSARKVRDELTERHQKVRVGLDLSAKELTRTEHELARSRKTMSDDNLKSALSQSASIVRTEKESVESAKSNLSEKNPDRVRALLDTATGSLGTVETKRQQAQEENTEVLTRLQVFGEEGLHEQLQTTMTHLTHLTQENTAVTRRAQAAKLLYVIMKEERDNVRRAYVAPLKDKIDKLGRLIFDKSFGVELTEDLSVASRVIDGSIVPFESLSGGSKEQIAMISRLACAMIIAKDSGASLILDDVLGYTDPERLKLMGVILAKASKECQIIILTCTPDRYSNVGEATVVSLH